MTDNLIVTFHEGGPNGDNVHSFAPSNYNNSGQQSIKMTGVRESLEGSFDTDDFVQNRGSNQSRYD